MRMQDQNMSTRYGSSGGGGGGQDSPIYIPYEWIESQKKKYMRSMRVKVCIQDACTYNHRRKKVKFLETFLCSLVPVPSSGHHAPIKPTRQSASPSPNPRSQIGTLSWPHKPIHRFPPPPKKGGLECARDPADCHRKNPFIRNDTRYSTKKLRGEKYSLLTCS